MSGLTQASCVPCRGGVPTLTDAEIADLAPQVPGWKVVEVEGIRKIVREFAFPDFVNAMEFAVVVGAIAESEGHHPDLHVAWDVSIVFVTRSPYCVHSTRCQPPSSWACSSRLMRFLP